MTVVNLIAHQTVFFMKKMEFIHIENIYNYMMGGGGYTYKPTVQGII